VRTHRRHLRSFSGDDIARSRTFRIVDDAFARFIDVAERFAAMSTYRDDVQVIAKPANTTEKTPFWALTKTLARIH